MFFIVETWTRYSQDIAIRLQLQIDAAGPQLWFHLD